jgi:hypothetical protein
MRRPFRWRRFAAVWLAALAAVVVVVSQLGAGAAPAAQVKAAPVPRHDYRDMVDFSGTDLDPFNPWDSSLLGMTDPDRIKDPALRADRKAQHAWVHQTQVKAAREAKDKGVTNPALVRKYVLAASMQSTMDPGCQLTSSTPDGFDLCGWNDVGDVMSVWGCSPYNRKQTMWAGVQESDSYYPNTADQMWRVWAKSEAKGCQGTTIDHYVNLKQLEAWATDLDNTLFGPETLLGTQDPAIKGPATTLWWVGSFRSQGDCKEPGYGCDHNAGFGDFFVRDTVSLLDQYGNVVDSSNTDNNAASWWWLREYNGGIVMCNGPRDWGIGCT